MAEAVLDTSALIAFLSNERGAKRVAAVLTRSCISAVNLAETPGSPRAGPPRGIDLMVHQLLQESEPPTGTSQAPVLQSHQTESKPRSCRPVPTARSISA